jgi:hypothetical protein
MFHYSSLSANELCQCWHARRGTPLAPKWHGKWKFVRSRSTGPRCGEPQLRNPRRFASHWSKAPLFSSLCLSTKCHGYFPEVTKISCSQLDRYITHLIRQEHPASRGLKARISGYVIVASFEDEYRCRSRLSSTNRTRAGRLSFQPAFLFAVLSLQSFHDFVLSKPVTPLDPA